jgi:hypothetical protein
MEAQLQARRRAEESMDLFSDIKDWTTKQNAADQAIIKKKATQSRYVKRGRPIERNNEALRSRHTAI